MNRAALDQAGSRLLSQPPALPRSGGAEKEWSAPAKNDDRTVDYLLSVRRGFEALGDATRSLAALLVLEASGARPPLDHPALRQARDDLAEAQAVIRAGRPTPRTLHPHQHLRACADRLDVLMASMSGRHDADTRKSLALLREATDHLNSAARALPGLEIVALSEGCACCAARLDARGR